MGLIDLWRVDFFVLTKGMKFLIGRTEEVLTLFFGDV